MSYFINIETKSNRFILNSLNYFFHFFKDYDTTQMTRKQNEVKSMHCTKAA